jgi:hypothetical protein
VQGVAVAQSPRSGFAHGAWDDLHEAKRYFDLALSIDPSADLVHLFSALLHIYASGDAKRAREVARNIALSQHRPFTRFVCYIEIYARDWDAALAVVQTLGDQVEYEQGAVFTRSLLQGLVYRHAGRDEEAQVAFLDARAKLEDALAGNPGDARIHGALGIAQAGLGNHEDARREAHKAVELYPTSRDQVSGPLREIELSVVLALLGDVEPAIDVLDRILQRPAWFSINQVKLDPAYDSLRAHPRYRALLEKDYPPF